MSEWGFLTYDLLGFLIVYILALGFVYNIITYYIWTYCGLGHMGNITTC